MLRRCMFYAVILAITFSDWFMHGVNMPTVYGYKGICEAIWSTCIIGVLVGS